MQGKLNHRQTHPSSRTVLLTMRNQAIHNYVMHSELRDTTVYQTFFKSASHPISYWTWWSSFDNDHKILVRGFEKISNVPKCAKVTWHARIAPRPLFDVHFFGRMNVVSVRTNHSDIKDACIMEGSPQLGHQRIKRWRPLLQETDLF